MKYDYFSAYPALLAVLLTACILGTVKGVTSGEMAVPDTANTFRAGTGYIEIVGTGDLLEDRASLTFWVKLNRATPEAAKSGIHHLSSHGGHSHYPWTDGLAYFNTFRDSRVNGIELSDDIDREQWHLVTITSEPGDNGWKLYQNTERVHQTTGAESIYTGTRFVLGTSGGRDRLLDGYLHDVRLYDRVLTAAEIADLLRGSHSVDGLVAHWPLEGGRDKVAKDSAGHTRGRFIDQQTMEKDREFHALQRQIADRGSWNNERLAREVHRPEALILEADRTPVDIVWRRTQALLTHLQGMKDAPNLTVLATVLEALRERVEAVQKQASPDATVVRRLFDEIAAIRRQIAFSNPLLDFDEILFIKRHRALYEHMCDQYYGIAAQPGGGLFVLENPFSENPTVRDLLADANVENGRLQGERLQGGKPASQWRYDGSGRLSGSDDAGGGAFLSPDLSFDGDQILFSYVEQRGDTRHRVHWDGDVNFWSEHWDEGRAFHVFQVNADGSGLRQLSDGPWNDINACWLPDGRIAFVSERRGGFLRCGRVCPVYTLFLMNPDGTGIRPLSYHETHEWLPSVNHDGMIAYTRWDYVDRDSDIAHHLWLTFPDGRDPRAPHGNYPRIREMRPWMEMSIRKIPDSHRYLAVAAPHHGQHWGSLIIIDLRIEDDHEMSQVRRVTPEVMLPESETRPGVPFERGQGGRGQVYGTPWPLSEDYYLAVYDPDERHYGMYLVDAFGNRELIYHDPAIGVSDPIPFRPRPRPPMIPDQTHYAMGDERQPETGTVSVANVYDALQPWPEGTTLKELRVVQVFPKATPAADDPFIGMADRLDQSLTRGVLGTVPIEADGSAYFEMPAGVPFYMQALDEQGMAVQTMRSVTYLHPGEHLSCLGCHEEKHRTPPALENLPTALRKGPAPLRAEAEGSYPLSFPRLVQPVLDANCVSCHEERREDGAPSLRGDRFAEHGHSVAFRSLRKLGWAKFGGNYSGLQRNKTSYSIPGDVGAHASDLFKLLDAGHHDVKLTAEAMRRITLWLDLNTLFYGDYFDPDEQARGAVPAPRLK